MLISSAWTWYNGRTRPCHSQKCCKFKTFAQIGTEQLAVNFPLNGCQWNRKQFLLNLWPQLWTFHWERGCTIWNVWNLESCSHFNDYTPSCIQDEVNSCLGILSKSCMTFSSSTYFTCVEIDPLQNNDDSIVCMQWCQKNFMFNSEHTSAQVPHYLALL